MAGEIDRRDDGHSPAGTVAEQRALDRPWRIWATVVVVGALSLGALIGMVLIPTGQRENAGLSFYEALCRAVGLTPGSPAQRQPVRR